MKFTPVRCYVLLDLVEKDKLVITRNGALEPSIRGYRSSEHPFTERRLLTAVQDLYDQSMIQFSGTGLFGKYIGKAEVAPVGLRRLHLVRRAQDQFKALAERHAAERAELEQRRNEELAAFMAEPADDEDPFAVQRVAAAERVRAFLDRHAERNIVEKGIIFRVDDHVLHAADLVLLCDAVAGPR